MGTHNSYHVAPPDAVLTLLNSSLIQQPLAAAGQAGLVPQSWEVTMASLTAQLEHYGEDPVQCPLSTWPISPCSWDTARIILCTILS